MGWDPGLTHARAIHWVWVPDSPPAAETDGHYEQFWGSCPDDSGGCSGSLVDTPQYQADWDIGGQAACQPNNPNAYAELPNTEYYHLPCPLYANWYGNWYGGGGREYSVAVNNYGWNRWNSPNIYIGIKEDKYRTPPETSSASLIGRRLDNAFLSLALTAYLSRNYVQNGISPRGQGRILIGFTFRGANGLNYVVEMNFSNMRKNLTDGRPVIDQAHATDIPVSNPWRDDLWAEYIYGDGDTKELGPLYSNQCTTEGCVDRGNHHSEYAGTYVVGGRQWGFNLVEGQTQTIFFDPWWVAINLAFPPSGCPQMLDNDGTPLTTNLDPGGYGVVPCGGQAETYKLPLTALFDENGHPAATIIGFYAGVEMAGTAVDGAASISGWTIQSRW